MKSTILFFLLMAATVVGIGCNGTGNPVGAGTIPAGISKTEGGIRYTFAVTKDTLSIFDDLSMTLTAFNETDTSQTILVSDYFYRWLLSDSVGDTIASGPTAISNLIARETIAPKQSRLLYRLGYSMADLFENPIQTGVYNLTWNLSNGLSFHLGLLCEAQPAGSGIDSPIYPLKVGNEWTFLKTYSVNGKIMGTDTVREEIVGEEDINGEEWFLLRSDDYVDQYITARQDGIYKYFPDLDTAVLLYKYPAAAGDSYNSGYELASNNSLIITPLQMTVDSTDEVLTVPYGQFKCYKYTQHEDSLGSPSGSTIIPGQTTYLSTVGPIARGGTGISEVLVSANLK